MPPPAYTPAQIAAHTGAQCVGNNALAATPVHTFAYDTRTLPPQPTGTVFMALSSGKRDGHSYVAEAYRLGIRVFWAQRIPSEAQAWEDVAWILCPDVLAGLQALAAHHRAQWPGTLVAVTGSNGKTIVKEWLAALLQGHFRVYKSPGSFNSQLGVPLAVLGLAPEHQVAVLEAGISHPGEMARLARILNPDVGVFTHFGDAHHENFPSPEVKLAEKLTLFGPRCQWVAALPAEAALLKSYELGVKSYELEVMSYELREVAYPKPLTPNSQLLTGEATSQLITHNSQLLTSEAQGNATLAAFVAEALGVPGAEVARRLPTLGPVSMRLELITDNPEITLLNDAYNADESSVRYAFAWLAAQHSQPRRQVILTDLEHQGDRQREVQATLAAEALGRFGPGNVWLVGPVFQALMANELAHTGANVAPSVEGLLGAFRYEDFAHSTVLLKGARRFQLERLAPRLSLQATASELRVDLDALRHNVAVYRAALPPGTRLLAMLKAQGYGGGDWQLAQELAREGVDYIGVALTAEGIRLRRRGITLPILVLNPDPDTLDMLAPHGLEPAVGSFELLAGVLALPTPPAIHLEFDTGMARLGFLPTELPEVLTSLSASPGIRVAGIMTHLASADDPNQAAFTHQQLLAFQPMVERLKALYPNAISHAMNSAGALAYPTAVGDMVRLGIGLYGLAEGSHLAAQLREVCTLATRVTQVRLRPAGTPIGYGGSAVLAYDTPVATLAIGYADGVPRALGNGVGQVLLGGQHCPILGRVCMDMLMADATAVPHIQPGDEAIVFGYQGPAHISLSTVAAAVGTIPYEILTHLGTRLRRVYVRE